MAGNIKGLNIEIGGSTTKLTQALKEPVKQTQELRTKLKDVNSALRFDSKNVDLLNQKQRILTETVGSTEKELKILKEAQKQYIESGKPIDGKEYVALEAKIAATERSLASLKKQQSNFTGELQVLGQNIGAFGEKTEALGKKFLPVTAAVTGLGAASYSAWQELDQAYDNIAAGTGATGEELEGLHETFDRVFGSMPASADDASAAVADISTRFGLLGTDLENASIAFLKFAEVNNTDVSTSVETVAKAMADAGIETKDLDKVLDQLTVVSQASGLSVDTMASALSTNGVTMRQLGLSTEDTIAMLATFEKNGVNTSTVLTGMKAAVKNCAAEGKDASEVMAAMFDGIQKGTVKAADAQELFGSKAGAAIYEYAKEGKLNYQDLLATCQNATGGMAASYDAMLDPADQFTVAMNNAKIVGADLFDTLQQSFAPILDKIVDKVKQCTDWFKSLSDEQKQNILKWAGIAAAIGPVLIGVGKMAIGLSKTIDYFGATTTAGGKVMAALKGVGGGAAIGTGALLAIVAAVAAVIGAFVSLWNNNEEFRAKMIEIWDGLKQKFQDFCQGIVDKLNDLGFEFNDITEVIKAIWDGFCELLAPIFVGAWDLIASVLSDALDLLSATFDFFVALFTGDWDGCWQAVLAMFDAVWQAIEDAFNIILETLKGLADAFLGWFGTDWDTVWGDIQSFFETTWDNIVSFFSGILDNIKSAAKGAWDSIKSSCKTAWDTVKKYIVDPITSAYESVKTIFNNIYTWISDKINAARDTVKSAIDAIKGFFNFEFKWPHIPLPHFTITGSLNPLDWLSGGLPNIGVEWYAKAMEKGMVLNAPTIFGAMDGQLLGAGEAGPEAVVGVSSLESMIRRAVASQATPEPIDYDRLAKAVAGQLSKMQAGSVVIDGRQAGRAMAPYVLSEFERMPT